MKLDLNTLLLLTPEALLAGTATLIFVIGAFCNCRRTWTWLAGLALVGAGVLLYRQSPETVMSGPLVSDALGHYVRWLSVVVGLLFVMLISRDAQAGQTPEVLGSLLLLISGLMLVSVSGELVLLFTGLELISIPTYVLLYLGRENASSQEATTKYFFLSILSSAVLLYGFSFLYGLGGTTWLKDMGPKLLNDTAGGLRPLAILALALIFGGLSFRLGVVPFHFYAPDVYQGTTAPNAALLSIVPKIAGMVALVRIVTLAMPGLEGVGWRVALIVAAATMTWGNVLALWQDNVRRLMAYSSIAHGGYLLVGLAAAFAAGDPSEGLAADGVHAIFVYLAVYALATVGAFAVLDYLSTPERSLDGVDQLSGVGRTQPLAGVAMSIFMFSLAGIPPLAGFWGKLALFRSAVALSGESGIGYWFIGLAIVFALNAAIAAAYYLRIVDTMYFRSPLGAIATGGRGARACLFASALLVLAVGLSPRLIIISAFTAARSLERSSAPSTTEAAPQAGARIASDR